MICLMTHFTTVYLWLFSVGYMVKETHCYHTMDYSFQLAARWPETDKTASVLN